MAGVVGESLFLTNEAEALLLRTSAIQQAIAAAYARAVQTYVDRSGV
jgi:N-acetylmuramoyl-L-alanine amidase